MTLKHPEAERLLKSIHEMVRDASITDAGRRWLIEALDPAHDHASEGFPDCSARPCLRPNIAVQRTIEPGTAFAADKWDCVIFAPDNDTIGCYYAMGPSPCDFSTVDQPANTVAGYLPIYQSQHAPNYLSTISMNRPDDSTITDTFRAYADRSPLMPVASRSVYRGITVTLNCGELNNYGQVYAAQMSGSHGQGQSYVYTYIGPPTTNQHYTYTPIAVSNSDVFTVPVDEAALMSAVPNAFSGPARNGVYMPMRFGGPENPFGQQRGPTTIIAATTAVEGGWAPINSDNLTYSPVVLYADGQEGSAFVTNAVPQITSPSNYSSLPVWWMNPRNRTNDPVNYAAPSATYHGAGNCSIMIWRGLAGGSSGLAASLAIRVRVGLEVAPNPESSDRVFTKDPCPYDPRALELYYRAVVALPMVYPANANGFGDVMGSIWSAIKSIATPFLAPIIGAVQQVAEEVPRAVGAGAARAITEGSQALIGSALGGFPIMGVGHPMRTPRKTGTPALAATADRLASRVGSSIGGPVDMMNPEALSRSSRAIALSREQAR